MPQYKLTYFDAHGRAEISRFILAIASVPYDDVRLSLDDLKEWLKMKPNTPCGHLPLLEVDGVILCESKAIARYLARKYGLAGKTDLDQARADMIVDCIDDKIWVPLVDIYDEQDEAKKVELFNKFRDEQWLDSLTKLEKILVSNKGGDGFFVGSELTWADLFFLDAIDWPQRQGKMELHLEKYPKLAALCKRVASVPKLADFLAKRKICDQ